MRKKGWHFPKRKWTTSRRFHPIPVGVGRRFGEQPDQLVLDQGGVLFRNDRHPPREGARPLGASV